MSGLGDVRVEPGEVELAGNEEEHGAHGGKAGVAAGFAFGGLEEAIEGPAVAAITVNTCRRAAR